MLFLWLRELGTLEPYDSRLASEGGTRGTHQSPAPPLLLHELINLLGCAVGELELSPATRASRATV